ncbi:hypothetical protein T484DRAFT_1937745 [Baffinella frigidus]|nr:hypothetical protein T484DRAFT_1937745 [Cryptophyta sp. CCMP2293]
MVVGVGLRVCAFSSPQSLGGRSPADCASLVSMALSAKDARACKEREESEPGRGQARQP